ncbi:MAG: tetraacyldisaccharide 4'-kinase [candidate division Zixibacteria bacterium RBG_16_53_22]|nr:MAG: tetraacyldisaccharide 4'-kinase [candidate division Zixibacteria bacterium RBG_16_53_22]
MRALFLFPFTSIYYLVNIIWELYWRIRKPVKVNARVISIGNIAVGGTGKTTLTAYVARKYREAGKKVAIVARGYKRRSSGPVTISSGAAFPWEKTGDEPAMLARILPGIEIYIDSDKTSAAIRAAADGHEIILVDDGFQHRKLHRDLDIVCLSSGKPFGNRLLLPAGILREPVRALNRANAIVWFDNAHNRNSWDNIVPIYPARKITKSVKSLDGAGIELPGKRVLAFCGIGNPESFHSSLEQSGCRIIDFFPFKDHHIYDRLDIEHIISRARGNDIHFVVTTMKDLVKVQSLWPDAPPLACLEITIALENEPEFLKLLAL